MENVDRILENIRYLQNKAGEMTLKANELELNIDNLTSEATSKLNQDERNELAYVLAQKKRILEKAKNGDDFQSVLATLQNKYNK